VKAKEETENKNKNGKLKLTGKTKAKRVHKEPILVNRRRQKIQEGQCFRINLLSACTWPENIHGVPSEAVKVLYLPVSLLLISKFHCKNCPFADASASISGQLL
jgi:hypothetical protein